MCNTTTGIYQQQQTIMEHHQDFKSNLPPPFALSTFHLLRNCNRLILSNTAQSPPYYDAKPANDNTTQSSVRTTNTNCTLHHTPLDSAQESSSSSGEAINVLDEVEESTKMPMAITSTASVQQNASDKPMELIRNFDGGCNMMTIGKTPLPGFEYIAPSKSAFHHLTSFAPIFDINRLPGGIFPNFMHRRTRGEKRTIPDELKDEKYYERRKRNNEAAKKSRDARKIREDRNAFRAALLEQENSILRAQVITMRDELNALKQLIATTAPTTLATNRSSSFVEKGLL